MAIFYENCDLYMGVSIYFRYISRVSNYSNIQSAGENEEDRRSESTDLSQSSGSTRSLLSRPGVYFILIYSACVKCIFYI